MERGAWAGAHRLRMPSFLSPHSWPVPPFPCGTVCRYYDAEIRTLLARHTRKRSNSGIDLRAGVMPQPLPPPGDPRRTGLRVADLTWTLRMDHEWVVRVAPLRNRQPTFGYMLLEADRHAPPAPCLVGCRQWCSIRYGTRGHPPTHNVVAQQSRAGRPATLLPAVYPHQLAASCFLRCCAAHLPCRSGRLCVERAMELGVEPGVDFTRLKQGESVELPDGRVVQSSDVLGPVRRGR